MKKLMKENDKWVISEKDEKLSSFMKRIRAIEEVMFKRLDRGATDDEIIKWLNSLKKNDKRFNKFMDAFIDAIDQTR